MVTIHAHYDGKVIVPEKPVDLPINQPIQLQLIAGGDDETKSNLISDKEQRKAALERFLSRSIHMPDIPLEALRRENLYEDRL